MKMTFETPVIVGALCERESDIPREISRRMARLKPRVAFLPFCVERRHLKNTVACMKLMDVAGLVITGRHRRNIVAHLGDVDAVARAARSVDVIVKRGKRFVGTNAMALALLKGARTRAKRPLTAKILMGHFYQTCVDLLTPPPKRHK